MGERTHLPTDKANSKMKKTWTMIIAGTAIMLLTAGVMLQVMRPTSAFPEDLKSGSGKSAPSGKAAAGDQVSRGTAVKTHGSRGPRKTSPTTSLPPNALTASARRFSTP